MEGEETERHFSDATGQQLTAIFDQLGEDISNLSHNVDQILAESVAESKSNMLIDFDQTLEFFLIYFSRFVVSRKSPRKIL